MNSEYGTADLNRRIDRMTGIHLTLEQHNIEVVRISNLLIGVNPVNPVFLTEAANEYYLAARREGAEPGSYLTPNGVISPKRETQLRYNTMLREFATMLRKMGLAEHIHSFSVPIGLRWKGAWQDKRNVERAHSSEIPHTDAWAGELPDSITISMPLWGDTKDNRVEYWEAPAEFEDSWLMPLPNYRDGAEILSRYKYVPHERKCGWVYLADVATIHQTNRLPGATERVVLDCSFLPKGGKWAELSGLKSPSQQEKVRMSMTDLSAIGASKLFVFDDVIGGPITSGFKVVDL